MDQPAVRWHAMGHSDCVSDLVDVVGMGRFELPASCSQIWIRGVLVSAVSYRSSPISGGLAGVMAGWSKTARIGRHGPVQTGLIHQRYIVEPTRRDIIRRLRSPVTSNSTPDMWRGRYLVGR